jgi:hypothetical protein
MAAYGASSGVLEQQDSEVSTSPPDQKKSVTYSGLCRLCDHADRCTFQREVGRPVLECDEFMTLKLSLPARLETVAGALTEAISPSVTTLLKGLCRSCEIRNTCTFSRPEGGVWHCEEYR